MSGCCYSRHLHVLEENASLIGLSGPIAYYTIPFIVLVAGPSGPCLPPNLSSSLNPPLVKLVVRVSETWH